jgi:hypothetical protein
MVYRTCGGLCDQVKRILAEHPEAEHHHIIKGDRLLSILAPLRSGRAGPFQGSVYQYRQCFGSELLFSPNLIRLCG